VVAFLRNQTGSEDLTHFRGLVRRSPWMVVTLAVFLLSLLGIPPLVGFMAKFEVFSALFNAGKDYSARGDFALGNTMYALLVIGGLNTVISAVYYIKVLKVMILDSDLDEVEGRWLAPLPVPSGAVTYATLLAVAIAVLGILWNPLALASDRGVQRFKEAAAEKRAKAAVTLKGRGVQP
jgi:NADH-quinone oxidoreductase subunit N